MSNSAFGAGVILGALAFLGISQVTSDRIISTIVTIIAFLVAAGITGLRERQRKNKQAQEIDNRMGR